MDHLEAILRDVAEELASWRARAQKAESDLKRAGREGPEKSAVSAKGDGAWGGGALESEHKALRQRVEQARGRVHDLLQRLTFLEEQAKESGNGK